MLDGLLHWNVFLWLLYIEIHWLCDDYFNTSYSCMSHSLHCCSFVLHEHTHSSERTVTTHCITLKYPHSVFWFCSQCVTITAELSVPLVRHWSYCISCFASLMRNNCTQGNDISAINQHEKQSKPTAHKDLNMENKDYHKQYICSKKINKFKLKVLIWCFSREHKVGSLHITRSLNLGFWVSLRTVDPF